MRKLIFTLSLILTVGFGFAQTCIFHENMEGGATVDSLTAPGGWNINTTLANTGTQSFHATYGVGETWSATTSFCIDGTGNTYYILNFAQIAKIEFFDKAIIEVSTDCGGSWTALNADTTGGNNNCLYLGSSPGFVAQGNKFMEASYTNWQPGQATIPDNTWWQQESFDISALCNVNVSQIMVRFTVSDLNNTGMGNPARYGWLIDDVCLLAAPCELIPPVITQNTVLTGTVYNLGPFTINATVSDNSGISSVIIWYQVNGAGPFLPVSMSNIGGNNWQGAIPGVNLGDFVAYYLFAADSSACFNADSTITDYFITDQGTQPTYCDNFETNNVWTPNSVSGSQWELGTPAYGNTNTTHSGSYCWDVDLFNAYQPNSESYVVSPVFDMHLCANCYLEFWHNYNTDFYAGVRMDYEFDLNNTWSTLGTFQETPSWYNNATQQPGTQPSWNGNSGGWVKVNKTLNEAYFQNTYQAVRLRFAFNAGPFSSPLDGYSFDDFCIILPPDYDAGATQIIQPTAIGPAGDTVFVIVEVKNFGILNLTNFNVWYKVDNGPTHGPFPYTGGTLTPGSVANVTCDSIIVPGGYYTICAWTDQVNDGNFFNDTTCATLSGVPKVAITYCNDFNASPNGWTAIQNPGSSDTWEWGNPAFGYTTGSYSPPNCWDINLNSGYAGNANSELLSPIFDMNPALNATLGFYHKFNCEPNWDGVTIETNQNGGGWQMLGTFQDPKGINWYNTQNKICSNTPGWTGQSNGWEYSEYLMDNFNAGGLVQVRFLFCSDASVNYDGYSIDNFCMILPPDSDVGAIAVILPSALAPAGDSVDVVIQVKNFGLNPIPTADFGIWYSIDGAPYVGPFAYNGPLLAPLASYNDTCNKIMIDPGPHTICAYTDLISDGNHFNDSICSTYSGVPKVAITYCDDFNVANNDWTVVTTNGSDNWEYGTPAFGLTTGAHSPPNCWDINLNTNYNINSQTDLYTPIFDMLPAVNCELSFWQNFNTGNGWDGLKIDYSQGGSPWATLGNFGSPGLNWYNTANVQCITGAGWSGNSNGWQQVKFNLSQFNNTANVQFRFAFCSSNINFLLDGYSIDDFCLTLPPAHDVGVTSIDVPGSNGLPAGSSQNVSVTVHNFGQNDESNFNVVYVDPLGTVNSIPYPNGILPSNADGLVSFPQTFTVPASGVFCLNSYTDMATDGQPLNDTTNKCYVAIPTLILPAFVCDDFEAGNVGWSETHGNANSIWELGAPAFGATNSAHSPTNAWDINLTTGYGPNADATLYTPYFDFSTSAATVAKLWVNYNTEQNWDGVRMEFDSSSTGIWHIVGQANQQTNWYNMPSIICSGQPAWAGNSGGWIEAIDSVSLGVLNYVSFVQFRFYFCSDASVQVDGFSIDDFCLEVPIALTGAALEIKQQNGINLLTPGPLPMQGFIANKGSNKIYNIIATLSVDGFANVIASDTVFYPGGLPNQAGQWHNFSIPWNASSGAHTLCMVIREPNGGVDLYPADDTICTVLTVFDSTSVFPNCTDFESGPTWVSLNAYTYGTAQNSWQLGTPTKPNINAPHSGTRAWVTNLTTPYPSPDSSALFTPIYNIQQGQCYKISFYHQYVTELFSDGGAVEFSTDTAKSWHILGYGGEPNWMNAPYIASFGGPPPHAGWSGNSAGWMKAEHDILGYETGQLMLRFRFGSDNSNIVPYDGWAIDDFCFEQKTGGQPCITAIPQNADQYLFLEQNMPNPASDLTQIYFTVPKEGQAQITITDLTGQIVAIPLDRSVPEGRHSIEVSLKDLAAGLYYYTLRFEDQQMVRKLVVVK